MSSPPLPLPLPPDEPTLSTYYRVLRGKNTLQELIEAFPTLEEKANASPPTLSDHERRQLYDLPSAADEAATIQRVSSRSRDELTSLVLSSPSDLSAPELDLLKHSFWAPPTRAEISARSHAALNRTRNPESHARICAARDAALLPQQLQITAAAWREETRRCHALRDEKQRRWGGADPFDIPAWIPSLEQRIKDSPTINTWGYIALYTAEAQALSPQTLDDFAARWEGFFLNTMQHNGCYRHLLDQSWKLFTFNAPLTASSSLSLGASAEHAELLQAFQALAAGGHDYHGPPGPDPRAPPVVLGESRGFLTNTFLVIDPTCINSVIRNNFGGFVDDMRILAFEAAYPEPGRTYEAGYEGWMWVRLEQLVDGFYEARMNDSPRMDVLWKAAQGSRHKAFASLDPDEARIFSSTLFGGPPADNSILGKRRRYEPSVFQISTGVSTVANNPQRRRLAM